ncbi:MAG: SHOCT-like domain-containing protein [Planctomycetota bacterium]|jgi:hypothetical protein
MTTERERIDRMLAEGKVSAEEAERLLAALGRAEDEDADADTPPVEKIAKPRLSRLALAGALGMPAAGVAFLVVAGLGIAVGSGPRAEERALAGGALVAAAVALVGVGVSIAGLVAIRRAPGELTGRRAARLGIIVPPIVGAVTFAVIVALAAVSEVRRQERARAEFREYEERRLDKLWHDFREYYYRIIEGGNPFGKVYPSMDWPEMLRQFIEPDWALEIAAAPGLSVEKSLKGTVLDLDGHLVGETVKWSRCILVEPAKEFPPPEDASGIIVLTDGRKDYHVPVVRVARKWYLARKPVETVPAGAEVTEGKAAEEAD